MASIQHQIIYLGARMYPCGATRVIKSHLEILKQQGFDVRLACNGMFASEIFCPDEFIEIRSFRELEIQAETVVFTSFLLEHMARNSRIDCQSRLQLVQGMEVDYSSSEQRQTKDWVDQAINQSAADRILTPSVGLAKRFRDRYRADRIDVIWPYVDSTVFFPGQTVRDRPRILVIGNLNYETKGLSHAYRALNELDPQQFQLIRMANRPLAKGEICDEFHQDPTLRQIGEIYRSADLLIYPSLSEGFGLPVLEAMSSGVPVITTSCVGMHGWVKDRINAIIVPKKCHRSIADAILELESNPPLRKLLVENGLRTAALFNRERTAKRLLQAVGGVSSGISSRG